VSRRNAAVAGAWIAAAVVALITLGVGAMHISTVDALRAVAAGRHDDPTSIVMWDARLPRLVLGVAVGLALPTATVLMQLILVNPVAEPALLGLGSASALGSAAAIASGAAFASTSTFVAAFAVTVAAFLALLIGDHTQLRSAPERMILQGVAVGSLLGGITGVVTSSLHNPQLRSVATWSMGSLAMSTLRPALTVLAISILGLVGVVAAADRLDPLLLGSTYALSRGVNTRRTRLLAMLLAAALVAAGTAACGVVPFVGLVATTAARSFAGATTRRLVLAASALGVIVVLSSDALARTAYAPLELPIGLVTSMIGAPVMFAAIRRRRGA
jgi:iron complex transport system permease protein